MLLDKDISQISVVNQNTGDVLALISEEEGTVDTFNEDIVVIVKPKTKDGRKKHANASDSNR